MLQSACRRRGRHFPDKGMESGVKALYILNMILIKICFLKVCSWEKYCTVSSSRLAIWAEELFEKLYIAAPSWKEGHIGQFCFQASGNPLFCLNTSQQRSPAFECGKSASAPINSHLPGPSPGHGVKSPVVLSGPPPLAWSQPAEGRGPHTLLAALTPRSSLE